MANIIIHHWPTALSMLKGDKYHQMLARQTPEEKAAALAAFEAMIPARYRTVTCARHGTLNGPEQVGPDGNCLYCLMDEGGD